MPKVTSTITVERARIGLRNFSGAQGKYNPAGNRNFCVFFERDQGLQLERDGWNIRWLQPRNPDEEMVPYLQVKVEFSNIPPQVVMIANGRKSNMDESTINILDWAEIANVDLIIRPYNWEVNEKSGVKAYLKTMYVTIATDEFESKYANVPDSAANSIGIND